MTAPETTRPTLAVLLRTAADWLTEHGGLRATDASATSEGVTITDYASDADAMREAVKLLGGRWKKETSDSGLFYLSSEVAPGVTYRLVVWREQVCTRVVVGTREVQEPDPEAVAALPTVTRTVEDVEWRCEPLLASRGEQPVLPFEASS